MSKMLVIKKVSKEDPSAAFSAGFASAGPLPTNGTKVSIPGPSVYKNLVPKPATAPTKVPFSRYHRHDRVHCVVLMAIVLPLVVFAGTLDVHVFIVSNNVFVINLSIRGTFPVRASF